MAAGINVFATLAGAGVLVWPTPPYADVAPPSRMSAIEVLITDPSRFTRRQGQPVTDQDLAPAARVPELGSVTAVVFFKDCAPGTDGRCHVAALFSVTDPKGDTKGPAELRLWDRAPGSPGALVRPSGAPTVGFEAGDPPGVYRIAMVVTDEVAGVTLKLSQEVRYGG